MAERELTPEQRNYATHLQLDTLLSAMRPITPHPEEHFFLTVHHAVEIWFKHLIYDMGRIIALLEADRVTEANWLLKRAGEIMRLADAHWTVLETLSTADFHEFRSYLGNASGLQSRQFRELEVMCGICELAGEDYCNRVRTAWPGLIESHPKTLRRAFFGAIGRAGVPLVDIYNERWQRFDLFTLCEATFELDRRFQSWRYNHILMVQRQIGIRTRGTGGTLGTEYLTATLKYLFFPELWELRHEIAALHGGEVAAPKPK